MKYMTLVLMLSACTLSFQNISTNGKADDVVDKTQSASPNVSTPVTLPLEKAL